MKNEEILRIEYTVLFNRYLKKAPLEIKIAFREARELFTNYPNHPNLRNHTLRDKFSSFRSINVTDDWRALYKIQKSKLKTTVTFYILGTHTQLYE